jgi:hypothetical protein
VSNELPTDIQRDCDEPAAPVATDPPLVLIDGDEDLACVDDTCLPADVTQ